MILDPAQWLGWKVIQIFKKKTEHALPSETPAETKTKINTIAEKQWLRKQKKQKYRKLSVRPRHKSRDEKQI